MSRTILCIGFKVGNYGKGCIIRTTVILDVCQDYGQITRLLSIQWMWIRMTSITAFYLFINRMSHISIILHHLWPFAYLAECYLDFAYIIKQVGRNLLTQRIICLVDSFKTFGLIIFSNKLIAYLVYYIPIRGFPQHDKSACASVMFCWTLSFWQTCTLFVVPKFW